MRPERAVSRRIGALRHRWETLLWRTRRGRHHLLLSDLRRLERWQQRGAGSPFHSVESSRWSQNGEDGIIELLVDELGIERGYFVEIGAADGEQNCTRALAERGWSGLWLEGDDSLATHARSLVLPGHVEVLSAMVHTDNVVALLDRHGAGRHIDLLSLDVDGNDYWILRRLLESSRPSVLVLECNGEHPYPWVSRHRTLRHWNHDWDYGASLWAYVELLGPIGYELVGCDSSGVNCFFVKRDLVTAAMLPGTADRHYVAPAHRRGAVGHPRWRPEGSDACPSLRPEELSSIRLEPMELLVHDDTLVTMLIDVTNPTTRTLTSDGPTPVHLAPRVYVDGVEVDDDDPQRSVLVAPVGPGKIACCAVVAQLPAVDGDVVVVPTLVQEGVAWRPADIAEGAHVRPQPADAAADGLRPSH